VHSAIVGGWRLMLVYLVVWGEALLQAMASRGDNGRYEQPVSRWSSQWGCTWPG